MDKCTPYLGNYLLKGSNSKKVETILVHIHHQLTFKQTSSVNKNYLREYQSYLHATVPCIMFTADTDNIRLMKSGS